MTDVPIIKILETADIDQVSRFSMSASEDRPLRDFIRRKAIKSSDADITKTYVIKRENSRHVLAYISLMCAEVKLENTYQIDDKTDANNYEYQPAVRIARLAVCDDCQKQGWGKLLVEFAIGIVMESIRPHAGCRFLILDAKTKSIKFYKDRGFRLLDTENNKASENPLMFMDLKSLSSVLES